MKKQISFISKRIRGTQIIFVLVSILVIAFDLIFLIFEYSSSILFISIISSFFIGIANYLQRNFYEVNIDNNNITIRNIWRKETFSLSDLIDVKQYSYPLPIPINPFLEFKVSGQKKIIAQLETPIGKYFTSDGITQYIQKLKEELLYT